MNARLPAMPRELNTDEWTDVILTRGVFLRGLRDADVASLTRGPLTAAIRRVGGVFEWEVVHVRDGVLASGCALLTMTACTSAAAALLEAEQR